MPLAMLTRRADFVAITATRQRIVLPALTLEWRAQPAPQSPCQLPPPPTIRWGFTATRKLGGAVVRNRAKRRLRALARACPSIRAGHDVVLVARKPILSLPFATLQEQLAQALARAKLLA